MALEVAAGPALGVCMLFMTLDMPDEAPASRGHSLKMTTARSVRFFVNLGLGLVFMVR
jgi:hypothetical protein